MIHPRKVIGPAIALLGVLSWMAFPHGPAAGQPVVHAQGEAVPTFKRDPSWPKPLPNNWGLGILWAVNVGPKDHVWALNAIDGYEERIAKDGKIPAPPILEFDPDGNLVRAWGGRDQGYPWFYGAPRGASPQGIREHSLNVDREGNVWISGGNHLVLKFSQQGKFLLQIGKRNETGGSNDPERLGSPAGIGFYPPAHPTEVFIADGYINRRIAVYDAHTGQYKRHWGRYGKPPDDTFEPGPQPPWPNGAPGTFPRFAHGVDVSNDGLVYVADRAHQVTWVFKVDGTFVKDYPAPGVFNSVAFSADPEQYYLYGAGINRDKKIHILRRSDMTPLGSFDADGQQYFGSDSHGNLFICGQPGVPQPQKLTLTSCPRKKC